ncbi:MAG: hypothetical protein CMI24_05540 [Opitutae bacterium]|nr:hypothetical protein [Opitutae bacterium]
MKILKSTISFIFFWFVCSCSSPLVHEGTYKGEIVMEDGASNITLELRKGGVATLDGLYGKKIEGSWENERVGGVYEDDVWATFNFPEYRVRLDLRSNEGGLILVKMSARLEGKTILRTLHLKEEKPLLRKF